MSENGKSRSKKYCSIDHAEVARREINGKVEENSALISSPHVR
jgi:hypothetical protein